MNTDYNLGLEVHNLLKENNLENPMCSNINLWDDKAHLAKLEDNLRVFIENLGLDVRNESLTATPKRMVNLFINELFRGLDYKNFPEILMEKNVFSYNQPLVLKNIRLNSTCEHHFVAMRAHALIAYIPDQKIIGIGKLAQIANFFANRPQIQERLTRQIFVAFKYLLATQDVAIAIKASHDCTTRRRVADDGEVSSIELGGKFLENTELKASFYQLAADLKSI